MTAGASNVWLVRSAHRATAVHTTGMPNRTRMNEPLSAHPVGSYQAASPSTHSSATTISSWARREQDAMLSHLSG